MSEESYNGWTNYETWGVALLLDNDQGTYNEVREQVATLRDDIAADSRVLDGIWTVEHALRFRLADWLKDYVTMLCGMADNDYGFDEPSLMAQQLLGAATSRVDWDEIADHYTSES